MSTTLALTRKQAKEQGNATYTGGRPCKRGHGTERYASSGQCVTCLREQSKDWHRNNPDKAAEKHRKHRQSNLDKYNAWRRERLKERYREDKEFKASITLRSFIFRMKNLGLDQKETLSSKSLGYTPKQFVEHIESLWEEGMNWDNHGEWHIDHVKPLSAFIKEGEQDPAVVNALSNLKPVWAEENLKKGDRFAA